MTFCDVRGIGEHVKNSVDHQFIELLRFNVSHWKGASKAFVDRLTFKIQIHVPATKTQEQVQVVMKKSRCHLFMSAISHSIEHVSISMLMGRSCL